MMTIDQAHDTQYLDCASTHFLGGAAVVRQSGATAQRSRFCRLFHPAICRAHQHVFAHRLRHQPALRRVTPLPCERTPCHSAGSVTRALHRPQPDLTRPAQLEYLHGHPHLRRRNHHRGGIAGEEMTPARQTPHARPPLWGSGVRGLACGLSPVQHHFCPFLVNHHFFFRRSIVLVGVGRP